MHLYAIFHPDFDHSAVINRMMSTTQPAADQPQFMLDLHDVDSQQARLLVQEFVRLLVNDQLSPGSHAVILDALPAGSPPNTYINQQMEATA